MGKHLGVPIDIQEARVSHFTPLLDIVSQRIAQWQHRKLSQSVKLILINSILVPSIIHYISVLCIPLSIIHKIDGMIRRFFREI